MAGKRRRPDAGTHQFHLPVFNLQMPSPCTVGRVEFQPASQFEALVRQSADTSTKWSEFLDKEVLRYPGRRWWATANVDAASVDDARGIAREAIALLRLYQRTRYRFVSLEHQTFGLASDMTTFIEEYGESDGGRLVSWSGNRHGIAGEWTFSADDVRGFGQNAELQYLSRALRLRLSERSDVARRCVAALAVLNQATLMLTPAFRTIVLAAALETLLRDPETKNRAHRVAVRYAYLTCDLTGEGNGLHGPNRPACLYLASLGVNSEWLVARLKGQFPEGDGYCSAFGNAAQLMELRNTLLHEGMDAQVDIKPEVHERRIDAVILALVGWALRSARQELRMLDEEIRQLSAANPTLTTV